jgi:tripartite-type tricarboxylate transporter receptor subunit TctC
MLVFRVASTFFLLAVAALTCGPTVAQQNYPIKPIRLLLPFPPGAPSDMVGRTIGQKIGEQMGQNLTPDNRTGACGTLGLALAPEDMGTLPRSEMARYAKIIQSAGIKKDAI